MSFEVRLQSVVAFLAPKGRRNFWAKYLYWTVFDTLLAVAVAGVLRWLGLFGSERWMVEAAALAALVSTPITIFVLLLVGEQHRRFQEMEQLANTDELTQLPNRRAFFIEANKRRFVVRNAHVFVADADHFKQINDRLGHEVGDHCLVAIADHLRTLQAPDLIYARMGGEEFAILLPDNPVVSPEALGAALCRPIRFCPPGVREVVTLTLSAGGTALSAEQSIDRALVRADAALYRAKAAGRARAVIDEGDMTMPPDGGPPIGETEKFRRAVA